MKSKEREYEVNASMDGWIRKGFVATSEEDAKKKFWEWYNHASWEEIGGSFKQTQCECEVA